MLKMDKLGDPTPQRVLILRALQLGDMLCAVPALRALRSALPEARITLLGLPWASELVQRFNHYLDDFIEFPGFPGLPERPPQVQQLPGFLRAMQRQKFDLALQMQGSGDIVNPLMGLFGARQTAGFFLPGQYCPDQDRYLPYPEQLHEVDRHLALMEFLGIPSRGNALEFPLEDQDWEEFYLLNSRFGLIPGGFACVHPGARAPERRWPIERFAKVADYLAKIGLQVLLTGTPGERQITSEIKRRMRFPALDLAGETSLGSFAALLSQARLLVCNDTGASHVAAACRVPSVVLFSASDPLRWAPQDRRLHRIVEWASFASAQAVIAEFHKILEEQLAHA